MHTHFLRHSLIASALVCAFAAVPFSQVMAQNADSQSSDNQTVPDKAADAWITTKVKSELATTDGVKASDINVDTSNNVVTLRGTVASSAAKTRAVRAATAVKGVKSVNASGLTVSARPMSDDTKHDMSDMPASNVSSAQQ